MKIMRPLTLLGTIAFALALPAALGGAAAAADPSFTVVMSGLDNPRGLAFGPQGALYVAEAGRGGLGLENPFCFTGQAGGFRCYGPTGAVSRLWHGVQERVATGLPSQARGEDGGNAIGPHDIALLGVGSAHVTIGLQQPPSLRDDPEHPELSGLARIAKLEPSGEWRFVADPGAYEAASNPDHGPFDTNPYGLLAFPGEHVFTDAGGNSLLRADANGDISTLATFQSRGTNPSRATDSVPTSVAIGPDGAYYVGELTGFPVVERANVYRIDPGETTTGDPPLLLSGEACLAGFTQIIDIAFDGQGNLYVLQYGPGTLVRVTPDTDEPGGICAQYRAGMPGTLLLGPPQLSQPTSVAVGPDGALYVSNRGASAVDRVTRTGVGEVLRIEP
jgi:hypothetical protein